MVSEIPVNNLNSAGGRLAEMNNFVWKKVSSKLTPKQITTGELVIRSSRGNILSPVDVSELKRYEDAEIQFKMEKEQMITGFDETILLGVRVLDNDGYKSESQKKMMEYKELNPDGFDEDLVSSSGDVKTGSIIDKAKDALSYINTELGVGLKIGLMGAGVSISSISKRVGLPIFNYPVFMQMTNDIIEAQTFDEQQKEAANEILRYDELYQIELEEGEWRRERKPARVLKIEGDTHNNKENTEKDESQEKIQKIVEQYGEDKVEGNVLTHPLFAERLKNSLALQVGVYTWPRQIIGWGSFAGIMAVPEFRTCVDNYFLEATAISGALLASSMVSRMALDYWVLKQVDYSPDIIETTGALLNGKVDNNLNLKSDARFGLIGAPLDVAISSFQPPYSAAWITYPPYSIPAYLLAMAVDQGVFMATNYGFLKYQQRKINK